MKTRVSRKTLIAAYAIAVCADLIQICFVPLLAEGFVSPFDDVLDVAVCLVLSRLIGFHLAFLPSFAIKLIPVVEAVPTWTLAVFIANRGLRTPVIDIPPVVDVPPVADVSTSGGESPAPNPPRQLKQP